MKTDATEQAGAHTGRTGCPSNNTDRDLTADDLMELAVFTEQRDGKWRASIEVRGDGRIAMVKCTIAEASRCMRTLCEALAAQLNAKRRGDGQAVDLIHRILTEVPIKQG